MSIEPAEHCGHLCCDIPNAPHHDHHTGPDDCAGCQRTLALAPDAELRAQVDALRQSVTEFEVGPEQFQLTPTADSYSFLANGAFTVHNFRDDPAFADDPRRHEGWGYYLAPDGWVLGFDDKWEAARAGLADLGLECDDDQDALDDIARLLTERNELLRAIEATRRMWHNGHVGPDRAFFAAMHELWKAAER